MLFDVFILQFASTFVNATGRLVVMATMNPRPRALVLPDAITGCCSPLTGGILEPAAADKLAHVFKALADPTRVRLLSLIAAHTDAEACVCDLTDSVGLAQPTVSHHLKQLVDAGLITREQRGKWAYFRVAQPALDALADSLRQPATAQPQ